MCLNFYNFDLFHLLQTEGKDFVSLNSKLGIITFEEVQVFAIVNPVSSHDKFILNELKFVLLIQVDSDTNPDCAPLGLIKASLETKDTSWHGFVCFHIK